VLSLFSGQRILLNGPVQDQAGIAPVGGDGIMGDMSLQPMEPPKGITAEDIRAMFRETDRYLKEMSAETDRQIKKMRAEAGRRQKEIDQVLKETSRVIGDLGNRLGGLIEHFLTPKLREKFKGLGYCFKRSTRNRKIKGTDKKVLAEIDVFLESDECALAVEVKTHLMMPDIKEHRRRMEIIRRAVDASGDKRKYLGAVAGAIVYSEVWFNTPELAPAQIT
jgi:hypothetical protein